MSKLNIVGNSHTVKNESAVATPFVVSSLCKCDTWCSPSTSGCHTSTLGCHLSTLGCHCSTHGVTLASLGCHHSTKTWCHIHTHVIFNSACSVLSDQFSKGGVVPWSFETTIYITDLVFRCWILPRHLNCPLTMIASLVHSASHSSILRNYC